MFRKVDYNLFTNYDRISRGPDVIELGYYYKRLLENMIAWYKNLE